MRYRMRQYHLYHHSLMLRCVTHFLYKSAIICSSPNLPLSVQSRSHSSNLPLSVQSHSNSSNLTLSVQSHSNSSNLPLSVQSHSHSSTLPLCSIPLPLSQSLFNPTPTLPIFPLPLFPQFGDSDSRNFSYTRIGRVAGYNNRARLAGDRHNTHGMLNLGSVKALLHSTTCTCL